MTQGTVVFYRSENERPRAEVVLTGGEHLFLALDQAGFVVRDRNGSTVFEAGPAVASKLCAGLLDTAEATPLQILVSAVIQLHSPADVKKAFEAAAHEAQD